MLGLDVTTIVQILAAIAVAFANFVMAYMMCKSIMEIRRDRKRSYLEKRLEELYIPLINLFSRGVKKSDQDRIKVEEIIVSKRHLCGKKVAKVLPQHFTGFPKESEYFYFYDKEELKRWVEAADAIWEEYMDVLKEYYRIIGIKHYVLPEKPKWMLEAGYPPTTRKVH
jgi:hypothetical protein